MYLGDAPPASDTYNAWVATVKGLGGVATVWPFNDGDTGKPAARFDAATYVALYNAGRIDPNATQEASGDNQNVYVLADGVIAAAALQLVKPTPGEVAQLPGGITGFDPFANTNLSSYLKWGGLALAGVVGLSLVSSLTGRR